MKKLAVEINEIKRLIQISVKERVQCFDEELEKVYSKALNGPGETNPEVDLEEEEEQPQ